VPPGTGRRRAALWTAALLLAAGVAALLALDLALERGAFTRHELATRADELRHQEQDLQQQLEKRQAPGKLAQAARRLGMGPAADTYFLVVPERRIVAPSGAGPLPSLPPGLKPSPGQVVAVPEPSGAAGASAGSSAGSSAGGR
jgi:hypothetical protein